MDNRFRALTIVAVSVLLVGAFLDFNLANAQASAEHVYYGFVPPSTDIAALLEIEDVPRPGEVDELLGGTKINYTVPSGVAILDVVGLEDGTSIEIWDIYANQKIESATIDRLEKKMFYMPVGTFFKVEASHRIAALLAGGELVFDADDWNGGTSTFYPSVTGGFRGREFIFTAAPGTHPYAYSMDVLGYNFYLFAVEEADWALSDAIEVWDATGHLVQRGTRTTMLQSRMHHLELNNGAGNDVVFHLSTSGDTELLCCATGDYVVVPAVTGGYIGKLFYAPTTATSGSASEHSASFIVVPLEEGTVTVYDLGMNEIASRAFTASDVENMDHWYHGFGLGRFDLIAESTGDIAFMVGETEGIAEIDYLGDDIAFIGSRPNQEIRFFAPTMAVVFAPEALTISIDGGAPIQMAKDAFSLLESGVHSVSADRHVIVEVLAAGDDWDGWGSYLIEPSDIDASFEVPEGFKAKAVDYTMYIAAAAVAVVVVVAVVFMMRRRGASKI